MRSADRAMSFQTVTSAKKDSRGLFIARDRIKFSRMVSLGNMTGSNSLAWFLQHKRFPEKSSLGFLSKNDGIKFPRVVFSAHAIGSNSLACFFQRNRFPEKSSRGFLSKTTGSNSLAWSFQRKRYDQKPSRFLFRTNPVLKSPREAFLARRMETDASCGN